MSPSIDPTRTALLVMDYQLGIIGQLEAGDVLVRRAAEAIAAARAAGATVGFVRVAFADGELDSAPETSRMAGTLRQYGDAMHADNPSTQVHDDLAPEDGDVVVRKVRVGAFSTTDLHEQLEGRGVDTIVLAGLSTSGVVLSTVRDGFDRDFRVLVLSDVSGDPDPEVHDFLIERLLPRQAEVLTLDEFRAALG